MKKFKILSNETASNLKKRKDNPIDKDKKFKVLIFYPNEPMVGVAPSNLALLSACLKKN